jgi:hypothetical protein
LVTGHVTADGRPIGVIVHVMRWANSSVLATMAPGAPVTTLDTDATTDRTGSYRTALDPQTVPTVYWEGGNTVNLEIDLAYDGHNAPWNVPITRCAGTWCNDSGTTPPARLRAWPDPHRHRDNGAPQPLPTS